MPPALSPPDGGGRPGWRAIVVTCCGRGGPLGRSRSRSSTAFSLSSPGLREAQSAGDQLRGTGLQWRADHRPLQRTVSDATALAIGAAPAGLARAAPLAIAQIRL